MVNKLLIGFGVAVLVAVGSLGAWKLSGTERHAGALGPIDEPIPLTWRGEWAKDAKYDVGQVVSYQDSSFVAETPASGEVPNAKEGPWALMAAKGLQGAQGPVGTFNGTFQSPNGSYSLVVANDGIVLQGPPGTLKLKSTGIEVKAAQNLSLESSSVANLKATASATVQAGGVLYLKGAMIQQN